MSQTKKRKKAEPSKLCPECQIELTESYGKLECDICGYIDGETDEERYDREKAFREKRKANL